MQSRILYEDRDILVCYKPAGLAVQTARVGQADMVSELKNYLAKAGSSYLGIVHRLDQPVEGVLVFGKTGKAAAALSRQLQEGLLHKKYYAVVCGKPEKEQGELVDYLRKNADSKAEVLSGTEEENTRAGGKRAVLRYRCLETAKLQRIGQKGVGDLTLLEVRIDTGRFHQIRAQLSHAGLPILGDSKYGNEEALELSARLGIRHVSLCACQTVFLHPATGQALCFEEKPQGKAFSFFGIF